MRLKTNSIIDSKSTRKTTSRAKRKVLHIDEISDDENLSTTIDQQPSESYSSSRSTIKILTIAGINQSIDQSQLTDLSQEENDTEYPTSGVWKYATKLSNGKAKCLKCHREISCKDHSTTTLRRHLHRCQNISKFASSSGGHSSKTSISADVKKKFHDLVYKCIIQDSRSFGDLRKPGMARLLGEMLPGKYGW